MIDLKALRARHEIRGLGWPLTGIGCERCEEVTDGAPCSVLTLIAAYEELREAAKGWYDVMDFQGEQAKRLSAALSGPATEKPGD